MNDIDYAATRAEALRILVLAGTVALVLLAAGYMVITGRAPEWLIRLGAFWLLGGWFNRYMRVVLRDIGLLRQIRAAEKLPR